MVVVTARILAIHGVFQTAHDNRSFLQLELVPLAPTSCLFAQQDY